MDDSGRLDAEDIKALKEQEQRKEQEQQQARGGNGAPQNVWQLEQSIPAGLESYDSENGPPQSPWNNSIKSNVSLI